MKKIQIRDRTCKKTKTRTYKFDESESIEDIYQNIIIDLINQIINKKISSIEYMGLVKATERYFFRKYPKLFIELNESKSDYKIFYIKDIRLFHALVECFVVKYEEKYGNGSDFIPIDFLVKESSDQERVVIFTNNKFEFRIKIEDFNKWLKREEIFPNNYYFNLWKNAILSFDGWKLFIDNIHEDLMSEEMYSNDFGRDVNKFVKTLPV